VNGYFQAYLLWLTTKVKQWLRVLKQVHWLNRWQMNLFCFFRNNASFRQFFTCSIHISHKDKWTSLHKPMAVPVTHLNCRIIPLSPSFSKWPKLSQFPLSIIPPREAWRTSGTGFCKCQNPFLSSNQRELKALTPTREYHWSHSFLIHCWTRRESKLLLPSCWLSNTSTDLVISVYCNYSVTSNKVSITAIDMHGKAQREPPNNACDYYYYYYNRFTALLDLSRTTQVSLYQKGKPRKVKPIWIYCSKR